MSKTPFHGGATSASDLIPLSAKEIPMPAAAAASVRSSLAAAEGDFAAAWDRSRQRLRAELG